MWLSAISIPRSPTYWVELLSFKMGMDVNALSVSKDDKWIVCGFWDGASGWDAELERKVVEVEDRNLVGAVDVSPKSTRFSTRTGATGGRIWLPVAALGCSSSSPSAESSLLHWCDYVSDGAARSSYVCAPNQERTQLIPKKNSFTGPQS